MDFFYAVLPVHSTDEKKLAGEEDAIAPRARARALLVVSAMEVRCDVFAQSAVHRR